MDHVARAATSLVVFEPLDVDDRALERGPDLVLACGVAHGTVQRAWDDARPP
jgi:hypothetical protein